EWISINDAYIDAAGRGTKMTNVVNAPFTFSSGRTVTFAGTASFTGSVGGLLTSGTYIPVITNGKNVAASTAFSNQYFRVGNVVTVSGKVDINAKAAATAIITITLPIPSTFNEENQAGGGGSDSNNRPVRIRAVAHASAIEFLVSPTAAGNRSYFY